LHGSDQVIPFIRGPEDELMPTALIVEDEPAANQLLSMLVKLRGFETLSAFTGSEALKKADDRHPDLVFLDLMLPDINGYEVCKALKARRATCDIPVVMVTARLAAENRIQGFRAGAIEYVPKPYTPDQIFGAMNRAMSWRSGIDSSAGSAEIAIGPNDEVRCLHLISDLRSLLLSRTHLDEISVTRLGRTISDVLQRGVDWARAHQCDRLATFGFQLHNDSVSLFIHDESGWFLDDDPRQDGLAALLANGGFDSVEFRDGTDLRLTSDLPAE
jgi:DNA-binding response OmpR family regulator